ncbi:acyltransferase domain-containing protein [Actinophytocola sp.]|uniref:acyltransferase domain-containing protein n=1 Tax=Actinophytocola sp. TaxID=1872138 RepID=UPI00389AC396
MTTAFLFPGQGGYDGRALAQAAQDYPQVKEVLAEIDVVTREQWSRSLSEILLADPVPEITQLLADGAWVSQLAIYAASLAAHRVLDAHGVRPDVLSGHSLGEIGALVAAGLFSVADGARVVAKRVAAIEDLGLGPGRMIALTTGVDRAEKVIAALADESVAVAAANHPNQTVLSGSRQAIVRLLGICRHLDIGAVELKASFPFHSPTLASATPAFAAFVAGLDRGTLAVPVYSPITREYYQGGPEIAEQLAAHFVEPVHFEAAVRHLHERGSDRFVEVGGDDKLSKFVRKIVPGVTTHATLSLQADALALAGTVAALGTAAAPDAVALGTAVGGVLAPGADRETFAAFWAEAGAELTALIGARLAEFTGRSAPTAPAAPRPTAEPAPAPRSSAPESVPVSSPAAVSAPVDRTPDKDTIATELRAQYAAALEYPEEVFADEVRLEAELGVDSVKQVELLTRAYQHFGLPQRDEEFRLSDYDTMAKIVELVHGTLRERTARVG